MEEKKKPENLLEAVEIIVDAARESKLSESFFKENDDVISYLAGRLSLSPRQCVMLSVIISHFSDRRSSMRNIFSDLGLSELEGLRMKADMMVLVERGFIKSVNDFSLPDGVLDAFVEDVVYEKPTLCCSGEVEFMGQLKIYSSSLGNGLLSEDEYEFYITQLLDSNKSLPFVSNVLKYGFDESENALLMWLCNMFVNDGDSVFSTNDFQSYFEARMSYFNLRKAFMAGNHFLIRSNILESFTSNGYVENKFSFTEEARKRLFSGLNLKHVPTGLERHIRYAENITAKNLFFGETLSSKIDELTSLLQPEKFDAVVDRLRNAGMRTGFCCVFYGGPGTGKTEAALQLARNTGRNIVQVDISKVQSKWVGESQQNVARIFSDYNNILRRGELAPILLLNEADGLLGTRIENVNDSTDRMVNEMQNILLEGMERFEGIMIATTNLEGLFDKAFERRFIYKIKFEKPTPDAACRIWRSMLPSLSAEDAGRLTKSYDFSGGEIENISRKILVDEVLTDHPADVGRVMELCDNERFRNGSVQRIGFNKE